MNKCGAKLYDETFILTLSSKRKREKKTSEEEKEVTYQ